VDNRYLSVKTRAVSPENLIDIYGIKELSYIKSDGKKGLKIGALTTHREIEFSELMQAVLMSSPNGAPVIFTADA